jgi:hypothetical protein
MKRNVTLAVLIIFSAIALMAGCAPQTITYDGKIQDINTVQEVIADKLEVENPDLDLEVNISTVSE